MPGRRGGSADPPRRLRDRPARAACEFCAPRGLLSAMSLPENNSLAIIGAGPVGLEAAAEALEHGFDVHVFEQGEAGSHPIAWGHVRMFTPWRMNVGAASRRLLERGGWTPPDPSACPTGREFAESYLAPLAALPDLTPRI